MEKFNLHKSFLYLFVITIGLSSCIDEGATVKSYYYGEEDEQILAKSLNIPMFPYDYTFSLPKHTSLFSAPIDKDIATLGRVLFYDKGLSSDGKISCASCHKQELAFSDDLDFSVGVENRRTARNSIALGSVLNFAAYYGDNGGIPFFWDNRAARVQDQSKATLGNPLEMDMPMHKVAQVVHSKEYYKPLIKAAYGKETMTEAQILDAIGTFVNSITNYNTKFDKVLDAEMTGFNMIGSVSKNFSGFTAAENRGKKIYIDNCASCHGANSARPPMLMANNGLDIVYEDEGVGQMTGRTNEKGKFKVPTLRNIARTAPYMHDGRFKSLSDVIDHYSTGIKNHPNLDIMLKNNGQPIKMNFTEAQKSDLVSFLLTLNEEVSVVDDKFADPFKN